MRKPKPDAKNPDLSSIYEIIWDLTTYYKTEWKIYIYIPQICLAKDCKIDNIANKCLASL